jgi:hypothetical protein
MDTYSLNRFYGKFKAVAGKIMVQETAEPQCQHPVEHALQN